MHRMKEFLEDETRHVCFDVDEIFLHHIENVLPKINEDPICIEILSKNNKYPLKLTDMSHFHVIIDLLGEHSQKHFKSPKSYDNIKKIEGSAKMLSIFRKLVWNDRIKFITASHSTTEDAKEKVLLEYFNIDKSQILHIDDKEHEYRGNLVIDDAPHNLTKVLDDENTICVMPTKPWNESLKHDNLNRFHDLNEFNKVLKKYISSAKKQKKVQNYQR